MSLTEFFNIEKKSDKKVKKPLDKVKRLGIIKDEDGNVLFHRTILKIVMNPILRKFGCSIVSKISDKGEFMGYQVKPYPKYCKVII